MGDRQTGRLRVGKGVLCGAPKPASLSFQEAVALKFQEVEDLRLDCDLILAAAQLTAAGIEHEVTEMIGKIPNPAGPCQPSARP